MGNSELRNYEVFCTTHSRIIQALSLEHAMSKFKDIDDGKIIGAWDSEYYNATESLPVIDNTVSHSPTEPEFDTLQEGDWFQGTEEQYRNVLKLEGHDCFKRNGNNWVKAMVIDNHCVFSDSGLYWQSPELKKTQLAPEEFLRRAENTFKTK